MSYKQDKPDLTGAWSVPLGCRPPGVSLEQWQQAQPGEQPQGEPFSYTTNGPKRYANETWYDSAARYKLQRDEAVAALKMVEGAITWAKREHGNRWIKHISCDWSFLLNTIARIEGRQS